MTTLRLVKISGIAILGAFVIYLICRNILPHFWNNIFCIVVFIAIIVIGICIEGYLKNKANIGNLATAGGSVLAVTGIFISILLVFPPKNDFTDEKVVLIEDTDHLSDPPTLKKKEEALEKYLKTEKSDTISDTKFQEKIQEVKNQRNNISFTVNDVTFEMIFVEGGTFTMGCTAEQGSKCSDEEKPAHQVTVNSFYIGKYEVTQAQWKAVMGTTARQQREKAIASRPFYTEDSDNNKEGDNYPMSYVSWNDAQVFIRKMNELTDKNFRLPTEAEWEYAARGGTQSKYYRYSGSNKLDDVAWYYGNSGLSPHPVGAKIPNELGIYDMSGNVWEWCSDWYNASYYSSSPQNNPKGPSSGTYRVIRGNSWHHHYSQYCYVASRSYNEPELRNGSYSFRLVLIP